MNADPDPFAPELLAARRRRVFAGFSRQPDCLVAGTAGDDSARMYLTGAHEGVAFIHRDPGADGQCVRIVAHKMLAEAAERAGHPVLEFRGARQHAAAIRKAIGDARRIAIAGDRMTTAARKQWREDLPGTSWTDLSAAVQGAAAAKDEAELALLRRMTAIVSRVMARVPGWLREGVAEAAIKARFECALLRGGAGRLTFGAMVAFGENTALPHALTGARPLRRGDLVMIDAGGARFGYGSDMTRTFAFGRPSAEARKVYRIVLDAHLESFEMFAAGKSLRQVNRAIDRRFRAAGYGPFIHSVGHSLGPVGVPVHGRLGEVFTIEPGLYLRGRFGVRIEDDVLVTPDGLETLTDYPTDLVTVD